MANNYYFIYFNKDSIITLKKIFEGNTFYFLNSFYTIIYKVANQSVHNVQIILVILYIFVLLAILEIYTQ